MKARHLQLVSSFWLVSYLAAQTLPAAHVQTIQVRKEGNDIRVEVTFTGTVKPSVTSTTHPDRLILDLPDTLNEGRQKRIAVHSPGILRVRMGLNQASPPVTRIVVDLDQSVPYRLVEEQSRVTLVLSPSTVVRSGHAPPASAMSGGLAGIFRPGQKSAPPNVPANEEIPSRPQDAGSAGLGSAPAKADTRKDDSNLNAEAPTSISSQAAIHTSNAGSSFPAATQLAQSADSGSMATVTSAQASRSESDPQHVSKAPVSSAEPNGAAMKSISTTDQTLLTLQAGDPSLHTAFRVKYVADGVAYLDGGSTSGLGENVKLEIRDTDLPVQQGTVVDPNDPGVIAELVVSAVAETSAVADIQSPKRPVKVGDLAYLSSDDAQALIQQRTLSATRKYPAVVTFTDNDTMDEEAHDEVPRPPQPSVNHASGMFGFNYVGTISSGSVAMTSTNLGGVTRLDFTRIGGTYWNARGYWRGNFNSSSATSQPTLQDLINRTYHLSMTYDNPNSRLVAGFGRLYLPWAPSLDTIDGGYFGARISKTGTVGMFVGSTPDPTSYSYNPNGKIAGMFVNFEGGSYDGTHYTSTSGAGLNAIGWQISRPFVFFENSVTYKRFFAIYDSMQLDSPRGNPATPAPGPGLGRNFLTIRIQPHPRFELDVNHTYFRDVPTYDPTLISTGLLDKFLFQGFSVGGRVEVVRQVWVYTDIGQSNRTGDAQNSLNQSFGMTFNRIPKLDLRLDAHYSRFSSSYGSGSYRALSISRSLSERLHLDVLLGDQSFASTLTSNNLSRFINVNAESSFGAHYFLQGGFTVDRGSMNYNQWLFTLGYRFDSRSKRQ